MKVVLDMKHPFVWRISTRKEGKGARRHRRGPINTRLRYISGWRQRTYSHQRDQRCAWGGRYSQTAT